MCVGARECLCWNSIAFNGAKAAELVVEAIIAELETLQGFHEQFADMVQLANQLTVGASAGRWQQLRRDEAKLENERGNLVGAIAAFGPRPEFRQKLQELDAKSAELGTVRSALEQIRERQLVLPKSPAALRESFSSEFRRLAIDSPEFGNFLRLLVPQFHVYLVRMVDGGMPLPRAIVELNLAGDFPDVPLVAELRQLVMKRLTFDLFEPPVRERIREHAVQIVAENPHLTRQEILKRLPEEASVNAVSDALQLHQLMQQQGLASPYVRLFDPPMDLGKMKRHRHPRYSFQPRSGYEPPPLD